ncbi:hypothetical protein [Thalassospira xiamenensis]|uniref:hypothetical protein n=1 Tax=Thalassospira xiamenensis TaxID=220697 RepID=UPI000DEDD40F|nr:hypothetical protein [Thalassospira xiamenensis]RCK41845.1 hypothetical protein TH24_05535 [Thalassospira xiamenensis]
MLKNHSNLFRAIYTSALITISACSDPNAEAQKKISESYEIYEIFLSEINFEKKKEASDNVIELIQDVLDTCPSCNVSLEINKGEPIIKGISYDQLKKQNIRIKNLESKFKKDTDQFLTMLHGGETDHSDFYKLMDLTPSLDEAFANNFYRDFDKNMLELLNECYRQGELSPSALKLISFVNKTHGLTELDLDLVFAVSVRQVAINELEQCKETIELK